MFGRKHFNSALFVGDEGNDGVAVLVVGGCYGTGKEAAILSTRSNQTTRDLGNPWRWQKLSPMQMRRRHCPGMLLLRRDRFLVAGGGSRTAELLHLPREDNDSGVWTRIQVPLTKNFFITFRANFNNRILAFG